MERVISRAELKSEDSSASSSPEPDDDIEEIKHFKAFDVIVPSETGQVAVEKNAAITTDDELDFRLFAAGKPTETSGKARPAQKIRLRSPSVDATNAGFVQPSRKSEYYFARPLSLAEHGNLEASALSGQRVLALSKSPWPGSTYPWKVLKLPVTQMHRTLRDQEQMKFRKLVDGPLSQKRKRSGKKYRIKLRMKHADLQKQQQVNKEAAEVKEAAEREKRTRRNREKKVKKRMRDKAKKMETPGGDGDPASAADVQD